jgi:hypothetical protein
VAARGHPQDFLTYPPSDAGVRQNLQSLGTCELGGAAEDHGRPMDPRAPVQDANPVNDFRRDAYVADAMRMPPAEVARGHGALALAQTAAVTAGLDRHRHVLS